MAQGSDKPGKGDTVRLARPGGKVGLDERGHAVWVGDVKTGRFELMNTQTVEALIHQGDPNLRKEMDRLAGDGADGVVAREKDTGHFRILETESLEAMMNRPVAGRESVAVGGRNIDELEPEPDEAGDEELQLVSTQMLRQILGKDVTEADDAEEEAPEAAFCNPYDSTPNKK
ncbi:hypothetical protein [Lentisalinibacter salinarum]|uniref:hypothetical protein n=1 Tax=Lentisalinibacter salinarum TaxID=2992239 RepID=UPI0038630CE5